MLLIGLLCTSFGGCTQAKSPEQQVQKAIKSGSYDEALTIIKENPMVVEDKTIIEQLETRIAELQNAYEKETMDYDDVTEELAAIGRLGVPNTWSDLRDANERVEHMYLERNFQKVWLLTSSITKSDDSTSSIYRDYDHLGRLIGYRNETTHLSAGNTITDYFLSYVYEYNDDGKISGVVASDSQNQVRFNAVYSNDQLVEYVGQFGNAYSSVYFEYDKNGNIVRQDIENSGERITLSEMSYHSNGEMAEKRTYTDSSYWTISKFDENGNQVENSILSSGDYVMRTIMEYNTDGQLSYQASYEKGSLTPISESRYEYDLDGHISLVSGQSDGKEFYSEGVWDPVGNSMTFLNYSGYLIKQYYDEYGNCTSILQYDIDSSDLVHSQKYTYTMLYLPFDYKHPDLNDPRYQFIG